MFEDRLTFFTEAPHPAVWTGTSIRTLADTSILTRESTDSWKRSRMDHKPRESRKGICWKTGLLIYIS